MHTAQRTATDSIAVSEIQLDTYKSLSQASEITLSLGQPVRFWKEGGRVHDERTSYPRTVVIE